MNRAAGLRFLTRLVTMDLAMKKLFVLTAITVGTGLFGSTFASAAVLSYSTASVKYQISSGSSVVQAAYRHRICGRHRDQICRH